MATPDMTHGAGVTGAPTDRPRFGAGITRLTTETKAAFKTTELYAFLAVLAGILIAGAVVDDADGGLDFGATRVWLYATILTVGYLLSRGLAKSGSREPYDAPRDRHDD